MIFLKTIAILFFDILDKYIHQKRILKSLKQNRENINSFFDIGCHKGLYTDLILKNFKVKKIFMLEPQKNIFNFIKQKYKKMRNIKIFNYGASNKNSYKKIYINKHDLTSSFSKLNKKNKYLNLKAKLFSSNIYSLIKNSYQIKTIRLENLIKKEKIKFIDLLKIDTEGHELEVLYGLGKKINIIKTLLIEFHNDKVYLGYNNKKIHTYLLKNNFILLKRIKFPFTEWEDRIYIKNKY
tara:strand:+ start:367 stop:1080 length:714 start_codon:yes stop_codon:yes gene_type:complete